jgi:hypothetical protein
MIKDVIEIIKNAALRHKGVRTFRYQGDDLNNAQNNYKGYQVYVDDISYHKLNISNGVFRSEFQIYVLGNTNEKSVLDVQNEAYTIAVNIMAFIDSQEEYRGILSVYDYDIVTLSRYTDDSSAGVKLSLVLSMPSPLNWCTLSDNFNDEPYEEDEDQSITGITPSEITEELMITPLKLPRNRTC